MVVSSATMTGTITTGTMTDVSITPSSYRTNEETPYTFTFTPSHQIQKGGGVSVVFPQEYTLGAASKFSY